MTDAEIAAAFAKKRKRVRVRGRGAPRHRWPQARYKSVPVPNPITVLKRAERELSRAEKQVLVERRKLNAAELNAINVAGANHETQVRGLPVLYEALVAWRWAADNHESALKCRGDAARAVGRAKATLARWRAK